MYKLQVFYTVGKFGLQYEREELCDSLHDAWLILQALNESVIVRKVTITQV